GALLGLTRERLAGRLQVHLRDGLALLRREDDRRVEDDVVVEQLVEPARQLPPKMPMPLLDDLVDDVAHALDPPVASTAWMIACSASERSPGSAASRRAPCGTTTRSGCCGRCGPTPTRATGGTRRSSSTGSTGSWRCATSACASSTSAACSTTT